MKNTMNWNFNNSYSKLPNTFKEHIEPVAVKNPEIVFINQDLVNNCIDADIHHDVMGSDHCPVSLELDF